MVKGNEGEDHIRNWMRNKNTIEFLGIWEQLHNPNFKGAEFDTFWHEAGLNRFNMTPKKWIEGTNAIGIVSKSGRGGGTYAHKDIAFNWIVAGDSRWDRYLGMTAYDSGTCPYGYAVPTAMWLPAIRQQGGHGRREEGAGRCLQGQHQARFPQPLLHHPLERHPRGGIDDSPKIF